MCWPSRITQIANDRQQRRGFLFGQGGGRFVEDQQANLFIQRLGDLHQLLLTKAEVADAGIGGNGQIDLRQQLLTAQRHGFIIQQTMAGYLGAEENILQHGEMFHQRQLLMNNGDAFAFGIANMVCLQRFAGKNNLALIASVRIDTAQHLHQRRFPRPIFTA